MTCKDCETQHVYNMTCLNCAARHCRMMFYPPAISKWEYVKAVAKKHGHDQKELAERIKEIGNTNRT